MSDILLDILDTETASLEGGVCDIAIVTINNNFEVVREFESLIDPERKISPSAMGVHHITNEMVWDKPTLAEAMDLWKNPLDRDNLVVGGHNVAFDLRMIAAVLPKQYGKVCSLKLAREVYPDLENHQLQTIRYTFGLEAGPAHRAMGDVITCLSFLKHLAREKDTDLEGLFQLCRKPMSLDYKLTFGKHKGTALRNLPKDYIHWLLNKADSLDPDIREALTASRA
jgi:exodeoxyribonuclease X